jgi:hypothetical protein
MLILLKVLTNFNGTEHTGTSFNRALEHSPRKNAIKFNNYVKVST